MRLMSRRVLFDRFRIKRLIADVERRVFMGEDELGMITLRLRSRKRGCETIMLALHVTEKGFI
jgi:hypothetical protein